MMSYDHNPSVRVLHLITRYLKGGAETTTFNTLEALSNASIRYDLRLGHGSSYSPEQLEDVLELSVSTVEFSTIRHYNPISNLLAVGQVARYLNRENIHVLHTHSTEAGIIGRLSGKIAGTPIIIHEVHGDPITDDRNELLNDVILRMERLCATYSTRIITKSRRIRDEYLQRGIGTSEQYEIIHHGVDLDRFANATAAGVAARDRVSFLYAGRLVEGKGLFDLIEAFSQLDSKDVELLIAGSGPLYDALQGSINKYGIDDQVRLLGYRDDIESVISDADVLVLPSYREGTPRIITEALAAGVPVIATDIAGIPEQVDDGISGFLYDPSDISSLAECFQLLADSDKLRSSMGEAGQSQIDKFDVNRAQKRYRSLYEELVMSELKAN